MPDLAMQGLSWRWEKKALVVLVNEAGRMSSNQRLRMGFDVLKSAGGEWRTRGRERTPADPLRVRSRLRFQL